MQLLYLICIGVLLAAFFATGRVNAQQSSRSGGASAQKTGSRSSGGSRRPSDSTSRVTRGPSASHRPNASGSRAGQMNPEWWGELLHALETQLSNATSDEGQRAIAREQWRLVIWSRKRKYCSTKLVQQRNTACRLKVVLFRFGLGDVTTEPPRGTASFQPAKLTDCCYNYNCALAELMRFDCGGNGAYSRKRFVSYE